jgi:predicted nuclease of predicted toxin-antitoxin system
VPGRFPLFTDENIDGPIIRGLRQRGWDVLHATKELGEETKDAPLFQLAARLDRVFVSTDRHMLQLAKKWLEANRPFRMIWWEQSETQRIHLSVVLDAFEDLAAQDDVFAYPIAYLKLRR